MISTLSKITQGYGTDKVICDLDLNIDVGVLGLLGPNGAGKTTLLRTLATAMPPRSGELRICGEHVKSEKTARRARRHIGYLPQDFGFYPAFTVYEFVRYSAWLRGVPKGAIDNLVRKAVDAVGLTERSTSKMRSLSGGMLRRAGIAAALVGQPRLLLLDEPTVGLDPSQRLEFRSLIRSLTDVAVVLSTHLVEDVAAVCDDVVVLNDGKVIFRGSPEQLRNRRQSFAEGDNDLERGYMTVLAG